MHKLVTTDNAFIDARLNYEKSAKKVMVVQINLCHKHTQIFLILNFRCVLIVVSFLLGKSPASVYYCMPTFRNSLSVPSSKAMVEY